MEQIVKYIVEQLVSNKEAVEVTSEQESEDTIVIKAIVDPEDMGKVIGKNGRIAGAIRAIIKSASSNTGKRYFVKIGERED